MSFSNVAVPVELASCDRVMADGALHSVEVRGRRGRLISGRDAATPRERARDAPNEQARNDDKHGVIGDVDGQLGVPRKERDQAQRDNDHAAHDGDDDRARLAPPRPNRRELGRVRDGREGVAQAREHGAREGPRRGGACARVRTGARVRVRARRGRELAVFGPERGRLCCGGGRGAVEVGAEGDERDRDRAGPGRADRAAGAWTRARVSPIRVLRTHTHTKHEREREGPRERTP